MVSKWVIVSGASSGIGNRTAHTLLDEGYGVIVSSRNEEKLRQSFGDNENCIIIPWDLSQVETIGDYVEKVKAKVEKVHAFVHSAGMDYTTSVGRIKLEKMTDIFGLNTFAPIMIIKELVRKKMFAEDSSVVLISSLSAHEGAYGKTIYASTKAANEGFVTTAAPELAEKKIRINAVAPGLVMTEMVQKNMDSISQEQREKLEEGYRFGLGETQDVANLISFLVSEKSRWITGQTYIIDGGHLNRKC